MIDKSAENVSGMFAAIAPRYDFMNRLLSGCVDIYWRKYAAKRVPIPPGGKYLDICTGTADLLLEYVRRYKNQAAEFTGSDFCEQMLEIGRKKIQKKYPQPPAPINLVWGDACKLPFDDNSFDTITVSFGLRNTSDPVKALEEMRRVCKPGGTMAILEFTLPQGFFFKRLYRFYFRWILPIIGKILAKNNYDAYHYLPESVEQFPQGAALTAIMTQALWRDAAFQSLTFGIAALYTGKK